MKSDTEKYFIIFDTNTLYHTYDQKTDFGTFYFNRTYDNVVGMINQADIYEYVSLVIPAVVWSEMTRQIVEAHNEKLELVKRQLGKYIFPELKVEVNEIGDYELYIKPIIESYKNQLSSDINKVIELPLASASRFESIIKRAFEKRPPFEGKEKKSDKGFKDALIWESILEFVGAHINSNIIYYTLDNRFNEELQKEFQEIYPTANLTICKNETEIKNQLELWSKMIDKYRYQPIEEYREYADLENWIMSSDLLIQMENYPYDMVGEDEPVENIRIALFSYDDIKTLDADQKLYSFHGLFGTEYETKISSYCIKYLQLTVIVKDVSNGQYIVWKLIPDDSSKDESI